MPESQLYVLPCCHRGLYLDCAVVSFDHKIVLPKKIIQFLFTAFLYDLPALTELSG